MNKKIIIYVCLFFVSLGFIFIYFTQNKKVQGKVKQESFLILLASAKNNNYVLDKCNFSDCQTIDTISSSHSTDSVIVYDKDNILYIKNNKIITRNFINKTEKIIYNIPDSHTLIGGLTGSGDYIAWVTFDGIYKNSNVLNLKNNIYSSTKLDFLAPDDRINILLDKSGKSDALILEVTNGVQESALWFVYYDVEKNAVHKLVENGPTAYNIIKVDNNVLFYGDGKIFKINLDSGKKEEIFNWIGNDCYKSEISNDGRWLVENINNASGDVDKYLYNFTTGEKSIIEQGVSCGFYFGSRWIGNRYYLEDRLDHYLLFNIETQKVQKVLWSNKDNSLIDVVMY
jgi:hypothetical protein